MRSEYILKQPVLGAFERAGDTKGIGRGFMQ